MVLPTVLYQMPDELFERIMQRIAPVCSETGISLQILLHTARAQEAARALEDNDGIMLFVTCVPNLEEEGIRSLQLGRMALSRNRDRYVIYCAKDSRTMISMAPYCTRPAAIVTDSVFDTQAHRILRDIFTDYRKLLSEPEEINWITVKEHSAFRRININNICAVTASNKLIEICLPNERLAVHDGLENFSRLLDDRFTRCHRSCIVNTQMIQHIDFHDMTITLSNGQVFPLSRAFKQAFHQLMACSATDEKAGEV